jgi:hypothetical protein
MTVESADTVSAFERARTWLYIVGQALWPVMLLAGCSTSTPLPTLDEEYGFKSLKFETDTVQFLG